MGFKLFYVGVDGKTHTERFPRATDALARLSELLAPPVNRPLVYVTNDEGRDVTEDELQSLALKENDDAHRT